MFKSIFKAIKNKVSNLSGSSKKVHYPKVPPEHVDKSDSSDEIDNTRKPELEASKINSRSIAKSRNKSARNNPDVVKRENQYQKTYQQSLKSAKAQKKNNVKNIADKRHQVAEKSSSSNKILPKFDGKDMNKIIHLSKSYLQLGSFSPNKAKIHFFNGQHYFNVQIVRPCHEYKTVRCSANERINSLKPGQIVHISSVMYFDKKNHRTNLVTLGDHYLTGSTHFVKPTK